MADGTDEQGTTRQTDKPASFDDDQSQRQYDRGFESLIGQLPASLDATSQIVAAYFDQVEQTTRTARRVAEVWASTMILSESRRLIVADVKRQVLAELKSPWGKGTM